MSYSDFKTEYLYMCQKYGRDTNRKIINDLSKDVDELVYRIEYIKPRIEIEGIAMMYGEIYTRRKLRDMETELEFTKTLLYATKNKKQS